MNQSIHQLLQVILQGISWVLRTIEALWVWSWSQIFRAFDMSWSNLPPWKIVVGLLFVAILAGILLQLLRHSRAVFEKIAAAFWTMTLTLFGVVAFVASAGVFSRGFEWVVTTVPDRFWEKLL
jgi:C4-dicarboxylate transporter